MTHIAVPENAPGIIGLLSTRPEFGRKFAEFTARWSTRPVPIRPPLRCANGCG
jgi:hypothetical protein